MNDGRAVVQKNPPGVGVPFHVGGPHARLPQFLLHGIRHRLHLAGGGAAGDHEIVESAGKGSEVQDDDAAGLLGLRRLGRQAGFRKRGGEAYGFRIR